MPDEPDDLARMPEGAKPPSLEVQLIVLLNKLRDDLCDAFTLQIDCAIRDIRRLMKK